MQEKGNNMKYRTVKEDTKDEFDIMVNTYLGQGWELYGNPYTADMEISLYYCQAMIQND